MSLLFSLLPTLRTCELAHFQDVHFVHSCSAGNEVFLGSYADGLHRIDKLRELLRAEGFKQRVLLELVGEQLAGLGFLFVDNLCVCGNYPTATVA